MIFRALVAFLVLPGVFAGVLPALVVASDVRRGDASTWGYPLIAVGLILLLWCVRDFYVAGKGTLAPWDPPQRLVTVGLYRYVRNPMYVAVLTLLAGWSLAAGSWLLTDYAAILALAFHLRIVLYEEPRLAHLFGDEWTQYSTAVGRWLPRIWR